jgi:DNA polymerase III delta prime subunit
VGPPGTGKTTALLRLASAGFFECCGASISLELKPEVLYLAFNRSATEDAAERTGGAELHAATIHATGARALAAHLGLRVGEVLVNSRRAPGGRMCGKFELCSGGECIGVEESVEVLRRCVAKRYGLRYSRDPFAPAEGNRLFALLDYAQHVAPESGVKQLLEQLTPPCSHAVSDYLSLLRELGRYDFTTALIEAERLGLPYVIQDGGAVLKVRTAFVDEAQDLSPLMWRYLRRALADAREVVFALDFYQTVYDSLHGADMRYGRALLNAVKSYGGVVVYLEKSKRVVNRVAEIAKKVLPNPDPEYVKWRGRTDAEGDVYVITPAEMIRLARNYLSGGKSIFALAPTNADVLWAAALFLVHGLIPRGLKDMPSAICRRLRAARALACARAGLARPGDDAVQPDEVAVKLVGALRQRFQYVLLGQPPDALVCHYLDKAVKALKCGHGLSLTAAPPVDVPNPPPLYVDTPYTAKGLEADVVFVVDRLSFDVKPSRLALYVALTRSRGDVYVVKALGKRNWVPPEVYREAKKL